MRERVIEDLICQFPKEFFGEELKLAHRQMRVEGRRLDLLFEDSTGALLLVEIKAGEISREHLGQAGEYFGLLREVFPDRRTRIALLGTSVPRERKRFLEAFGVEVYIFPETRLLDIAATYGVDVERGLSELKVTQEVSLQSHVFSGSRFPIRDEASYFRLVNQISDEAAKEKLIAAYAAAKSSPHVRISFTDAGSAEFLVESSGRTRAKFMKVGISFKRRPPKAILTLHWEWMLQAFQREKVQRFRDTVDDLFARPRIDIYRAVMNKEKNTRYDPIDLHEVNDEQFGRFVEALADVARELAR